MRVFVLILFTILITRMEAFPFTYMYGLIAFKNNFVMNACNPNFTIQKDLCTGMYKLFQTIELSQIATC